MRIAFLVVLCINSFLALGQDLFNRTNSFSYAQHLVNTGQHDRAFSELSRIRSSFGMDDSLAALTISNSFHSGNFKSSAILLDRFKVSNELMLPYIKLRLLSGDTLPASLIDPYSLANLYQSYRIPKKHTLPSTTLASKAIFESLAFAQSRSLLINYDPKSPALAAVLSIVPGMGKIYAGRKHDGFTSLMVVSATAFVAYRMFDQGGVRSVPGWLYGFLSCGFYLGNIYGGYQAVKEYNKKLILNYECVFQKEFIDYTPQL
jgi:hypothetical protein